MKENTQDLIREVAPRIHRILVPLPKNPLRSLNAYLVKGRSSRGDRNLLIDTGFNRPECEDTLRAALRELDVDPSETDVFVTHLHSDHCGLMRKMALDGCRVYCSKSDGELINYAVTRDYWEELDEMYARHGYPSRGKQNMENHPGWEYNNREKAEFIPADEGCVFECGGYAFRAVWTPGHTPGHMCLYDGDKRILFCADHVLADITPNITVELGMNNPLKFYSDSLRKTEALDVDKTLTGHRESPDSLRERIAELRAHHASRLEELMDILSERATTAYDAASKMHWDISCKNWDNFPATQKWFAVGEAIAHLQYLYGEGRVKRFKSDDLYFYSMAY
ncbi:MAG: MBL fold metallo-hydrolase [Clostridiales Family XIII bacterium]|jgi:glyoxylase-like metal-dependent hydrolase (beta-lactamase superfamily II)|nr:MBL fold metallo-hydrolase [Clostridiales Family XIII bacterium]